jgi:biopolymer transport protein ExbB
LALDATLGNALKLAALKEPYSKVAKGPVMVPLLALGAARFIVGLVKWVQLSRVRLASEADLEKVLRHIENGENHTALALARNISGPAGDLLAAAIEHVDEKKEYIEEILYEKMLGARTKLERGIPFLALAATTGPLLGLLGTVTGMIATFKLISSFGSGDPSCWRRASPSALPRPRDGCCHSALLFHAFLSRKARHHRQHGANGCRVHQWGPNRRETGLHLMKG